MADKKPVYVADTETSHLLQVAHKIAELLEGKEKAEVRPEYLVAAMFSMPRGISRSICECAVEDEPDCWSLFICSLADSNGLSLSETERALLNLGKELDKQFNPEEAGKKGVFVAEDYRVQEIMSQAYLDWGKLRTEDEKEVPVDYFLGALFLSPRSFSVLDVALLGCDLSRLILFSYLLERSTVIGARYRKMNDITFYDTTSGTEKET